MKKKRKLKCDESGDGSDDVDLDRQDNFRVNTSIAILYKLNQHLIEH